MKKNNKVFLKKKISLIKERKILFCQKIKFSLKSNKSLTLQNRFSNLIIGLKKKKKICLISGSFKGVKRLFSFNRHKVNSLMIENYLTNFSNK